MSPSTDAPRLSRKVYQELRDSIVKGTIRPNQRLVETDLAEKLEISRTPVREGLQQLAAEGLVRGERYGWVVHEHTVDEIREIYETRAALEGYAARLAAERLTDDQIEEIATIQASAGDEWERLPRDVIVTVNAEFHDAILAGCGNQRLITMTKQNREFYFNHRLAQSYSSAHFIASMSGHNHIVESLKKRDASAAENLTREHILEALLVIEEQYPHQ